MLPLVEERRAEIEALCRQFHVRRLDLFGSAARGDRDDGRSFNAETSDLDFVVVFAPQPYGGRYRAYFGLKEALEKLLGRRVDLLTAESIQNPYLKESIERGRRLLYAA